MTPPPPRSTLFPYTTLFRSFVLHTRHPDRTDARDVDHSVPIDCGTVVDIDLAPCADRSEEHTSELQSHSDLVCRLLLEKKKPNNTKAQLHQCSRSGHIGTKL